MSTKQFRQLTGLFFIIGAVLVNILYPRLIINFHYPDILRSPVDHILTQFQAGGSPLIYSWLAFAWVGLLIVGVVLAQMLPASHSDTASPGMLRALVGPSASYAEEAWKNEFDDICSMTEASTTLPKEQIR